jgi:hypothetical protein
MLGQIGDFVFPCIHTTPKTEPRIMYSKVNNKGHFGVSKVIFGDSGISNPIIDMEGKYGMTEHSMAIQVSSIDEAINISNAIKSKKFEENNFMDNKNKQLCPKDRPRVKHMEEKELKKYRETSYKEKLLNVTKEGHETESKIMEHFKKLKKFTEVDFLRCNTNYILDTKLNSDPEKYAKFVYTIIPSTADLIKLSYIDSNKHISENYSFLEFVNQFLQPFMIYSKNIHFNGGYHFIRAVIEDKIKNYNVKNIPSFASSCVFPETTIFDQNFSFAPHFQSLNIFI